MSMVPRLDWGSTFRQSLIVLGTDTDTDIDTDTDTDTDIVTDTDTDIVPELDRAPCF